MKRWIIMQNEPISTYQNQNQKPQPTTSKNHRSICQNLHQQQMKCHHSMPDAVTAIISVRDQLLLPLIQNDHCRYCCYCWMIKYSTMMKKNALISSLGCFVLKLLMQILSWMDDILLCKCCAETGWYWAQRQPRCLKVLMTCPMAIDICMYWDYLLAEPPPKRLNK